MAISSSATMAVSSSTAEPNGSFVLFDAAGLIIDSTVPLASSLLDSMFFVRLAIVGNLSPIRLNSSLALHLLYKYEPLNIM